MQQTDVYHQSTIQVSCLDYHVAVHSSTREDEASPIICYNFCTGKHISGMTVNHSLLLIPYKSLNVIQKGLKLLSTG